MSVKKKKSIYNDPSLELTSVSHVNTGYYLSFIHTEFSRNSTYGINQEKLKLWLLYVFLNLTRLVCYIRRSDQTAKPRIVIELMI